MTAVPSDISKRIQKGGTVIGCKIYNSISQKYRRSQLYVCDCDAIQNLKQWQQKTDKAAPYGCYTQEMRLVLQIVHGNVQLQGSVNNLSLLHFDNHKQLTFSLLYLLFCKHACTGAPALIKQIQ